MSDQAETGHSSAMWEGANFKDGDLSSLRIPVSFGPTNAVLAERERCAKIAESIEEPIWAPNEWGDVGPAECRGGAPPAVNWEDTRALIARKIREGV